MKRPDRPPSGQLTTQFDDLRFFGIFAFSTLPWATSSADGEGCSCNPAAAAGVQTVTSLETWLPGKGAHHALVFLACLDHRSRGYRHRRADRSALAESSRLAGASPSAVCCDEDRADSEVVTSASVAGSRPAAPNVIAPLTLEPERVEPVRLWAVPPDLLLVLDHSIPRCWVVRLAPVRSSHYPRRPSKNLRRPCFDPDRRARAEAHRRLASGVSEDCQERARAGRRDP